eukprot:6095842-Ditylum_brightwellii.AAC.1
MKSISANSSTQDLEHQLLQAAARISPFDSFYYCLLVHLLFSTSSLLVSVQDTTGHVHIMVPFATHGNCEALRCNKGPQVSCMINAVIPALLPSPEKELFTIVNFIANDDTVISIARALGPNFLPMRWVIFIEENKN